MDNQKIDFPTIITKFDKILERGLCSGVGNRDGQMCIEAAICAAMDLPHGDEPSCVAASVRSFKIRLNDSNWSSPSARAKGLRDLGIAQIGSKGVVDDKEFSKGIVEKTIRVLIPTLFREVFPNNKTCLDAATKCEIEGTGAAARGAADAVARAAGAAAMAAEAAARAAEAAARAAGAAVWAAGAAEMAAWAAASDKNKYLILLANLALEVLRELKSPGCEWI